MKQITKEIKDYIHHYVGCDVLVKTDYGVQGPPKTFTGSLHGIYWDRWTTDGMEMSLQVMTEHGARWTYKLDQVTLLLRKLSIITEEEARDIAVIMFGQPDSVKWRLESKPNYLNVYRKHYHISFTIDLASGDVDIYDDGEIQTTINHHFITKYLLSKGFDLFGLIESGLALDKDNL